MILTYSNVISSTCNAMYFFLYKFIVTVYNNMEERFFPVFLIEKSRLCY